MKPLIICLLIIVCFQSKTFTQKLSIDELLNLQEMSLNDIDSLMTSKQFYRWDTSAGNLQFRFYGYSNIVDSVHELNYLQLSVKEDYNYPEIQFQTTINNQSQQLLKQIIEHGFIKTLNPTSSITYIKNNLLISYSIEQNTDPTLILYTFKFKLKKAKPLGFIKSI